MTSRFAIQVLLTPQRLCHYSCGGNGALAVHSVSTDTVVGVASILLGDRESLEFLLGLFPYHPSSKRGVPHYCRVGEEIQSPHVVSTNNEVVDFLGPVGIPPTPHLHSCRSQYWGSSFQSFYGKSLGFLLSLAGGRWG